MEKPVCCICKHACENEFGNNPYPINTEEGARCCDVCNDLYVIPARLANLGPDDKDEIEKLLFISYFK